MIPIPSTHDATISEARRLMDEYGVGGLMVTGLEGAGVGLVTQRDVLLAPNGDDPVSYRHDPARSINQRHRRISTMDEAQAILHEHRLEKLPLLDQRR